MDWLLFLLIFGSCWTGRQITAVLGNRVVGEPVVDPLLFTGSSFTKLRLGADWETVCLIGWNRSRKFRVFMERLIGKCPIRDVDRPTFVSAVVEELRYRKFLRPEASSISRSSYAANALVNFRFVFFFLIYHTRGFPQIPTFYAMSQKKNE